MTFTSYFGNLKNLDLNKCVAICRWKPSWYKGAHYTKVAPKDHGIKVLIIRKLPRQNK